MPNKVSELSHICGLVGKGEWGFTFMGAMRRRANDGVRYGGEMAVLRVLGRCRRRSTLFSLLVMMVQGRLMQGRLGSIVVGILNSMGWFESSVSEKPTGSMKLVKSTSKIPWNSVVMRWDCWESHKYQHASGISAVGS
jgi:hypothetical protein